MFGCGLVPFHVALFGWSLVALEVCFPVAVVVVVVVIEAVVVKTVAVEVVVVAAVFVHV